MLAGGMGVEIVHPEVFDYIKEILETQPVTAETLETIKELVHTAAPATADLDDSIGIAERVVQDFHNGVWPPTCLSIASPARKKKTEKESITKLSMNAEDEIGTSTSHRGNNQMPRGDVFGGGSRNTSFMRGGGRSQINNGFSHNRGDANGYGNFGMGNMSKSSSIDGMDNLAAAPEFVPGVGVSLSRSNSNISTRSVPEFIPGAGLSLSRTNSYSAQGNARGTLQRQQLQKRGGLSYSERMQAGHQPRDDSAEYDMAYEVFLQVEFQVSGQYNGTALELAARSVVEGFSAVLQNEAVYSEFLQMQTGNYPDVDPQETVVEVCCHDALLLLHRSMEVSLTCKPCRHHLKGSCYRSDCKFDHALDTVPCQHWLSSTGCAKFTASQELLLRGEKDEANYCPFLHAADALNFVDNPRLMAQFNISSPRDAYPGMFAVLIEGIQQGTLPSVTTAENAPLSLGNSSDEYAGNGAAAANRSGTTYFGMDAGATSVAPAATGAAVGGESLLGQVGGASSGAALQSLPTSGGLPSYAAASQLQVTPRSDFRGNIEDFPSLGGMNADSLRGKGAIRDFTPSAATMAAAARKKMSAGGVTTVGGLTISLNTSSSNNDIASTTSATATAGDEQREVSSVFTVPTHPSV